MEPIKVSGMCKVAKKMPTSRVTKNDVEIVTCSIGLGAIRVTREVAEQLSGLPVDSWRSLYDSKGYPRQRTCLLFPKRELVLDFKVEHKKDSGAVLASLKVPLAAITGTQFTLDAPDDLGECALMQFTVTWKARGDEVEDVEAMLGRPSAFSGTFKVPPQQDKLFDDSKPSAAKEAAAAKRQATPDRKSLAAGEKPEKPDAVEPPDELLPSAVSYVAILESVSISELQSHLKIGYNRAARVLEQLEKDGIVGVSDTTGRRTVNAEIADKLKPVIAALAAAPPAKSKAEPAVGAKFEREARELAAKKPRREPPKKDEKRGNHRKH